MENFRWERSSSPKICTANTVPSASTTAQIPVLLQLPLRFMRCPADRVYAATSVAAAPERLASDAPAGGALDIGTLTESDGGEQEATSTMPAATAMDGFGIFMMRTR